MSTPSTTAATDAYNLVHQTAVYVVNARGEKVLPKVSEKIADCTFDLLIAAVVGINANGAVATRKTVSALAPAGSSTIWFTKQTSSPLYAAWANAAASVAADLDDGNRQAKGHPGATVIPVALAFAEMLGSSRQEYDAAVEIGYNVGLTIAGSRRDDEFGVTNTWGAFGAVATASALLKLNVEQIEHAMGIAGANTPTHTLREKHEGMEGFYRFEGSDFKEGIPWAVKTGMMAVLQAVNGHTGPRNVLQFETLYDFPEDLKLGSKHYVFDTYFKLYTSCRYAHPATDAALTLQAENDFRAGDVVSIQVDTFRNACALDPVKNPKNEAQLIYSIPYAVALPLIDGAASLLPFTKSAFDRPDVTALAEKVKVSLDAAIDKEFPAQTLSRVTIVLRDGRKLVSPVTTPKGEATDPLTPEQLVEKCRAATRLEAEPGDQKQLIEAVSDLRKGSSLATVLKCLRETHLGRTE